MADRTQVVVKDIREVEKFGEKLKDIHKESGKLLDKVRALTKEQERENWCDPQFREVEDMLEKYSDSTKYLLRDFEKAYEYVFDYARFLRNR